MDFINRMEGYSKWLTALYESYNKKTKNRRLLKPRRKETRIPISEKLTLTFDEAAEYTNIGIHKLRSLANDKNNDMFVSVGAKKLIKRHKLEEYIEKMNVI